MSTSQLHPEWRDALQSALASESMAQLRDFLRRRLAVGAPVTPATQDYFRGLNAVPPSRIKAVIIGQDPYHGPGQAHGLSFSVPMGVVVPPSLANIYKELNRDPEVEFTAPLHGNLQGWADQGVLLLNSVLTTEIGAAAAHAGQGWEAFTDAVVAYISDHCEGVVFMLWGRYAQRKGQWIDRQRHRVLHTVHPSPLSAYRGFHGCGHFSAANRYLLQSGKGSIAWAKL